MHLYIKVLRPRRKYLVCDPNSLSVSNGGFWFKEVHAFLPDDAAVSFVPVPVWRWGRSSRGGFVVFCDRYAFIVGIGRLAAVSFFSGGMANRVVRRPFCKTPMFPT